eukprot:TRINITY_DN33482_c0_g1_i5.p1 TRINITY_DN33482_c0_g1~~TRINITY_DN33482_c0_g1_i5.p1  ORF type:complete len:278 (+),score=-23.66 TRINITY_DN33482_c0_g1_i5:218-1051(+)
MIFPKIKHTSSQYPKCLSAEKIYINIFSCAGFKCIVAQIACGTTTDKFNCFKVVQQYISVENIIVGINIVVQVQQQLFCWITMFIILAQLEIQERCNSNCGDDVNFQCQQNYCSSILYQHIIVCLYWGIVVNFFEYIFFATSFIIKCQHPVYAPQVCIQIIDFSKQYQPLCLSLGNRSQYQKNNTVLFYCSNSLNCQDGGVLLVYYYTLVFFCNTNNYNLTDIKLFFFFFIVIKIYIIFVCLSQSLLITTAKKHIVFLTVAKLFETQLEIYLVIIGQ